MLIEEYLREDGSSPYKTWFDRLDVQAAVKVTIAKLRMELGHTSNIKWFAGIGEYVIDWGPGYRHLSSPGRRAAIDIVGWWDKAATATGY